MYLYLYHNNRMMPDCNEAELCKDPSGTNNHVASTGPSGLSNRMVLLALEDYLKRTKSALMPENRSSIEILRKEKGKPYFNGMEDVFFSVSHSGNWWGCLMSGEEVGFDLEVIRNRVKYEKVAARFFTTEEHQYVLEKGLEGFFDIWVRKEAYVKFLGTGLSTGLKSFSVTRKGELLSKVLILNPESGLESCSLRPCELSEEIRAAYCCESGSQIMKTIMLSDEL